MSMGDAVNPLMEERNIEQAGLSWFAQNNGRTALLGVRDFVKSVD